MGIRVGFNGEEKDRGIKVVMKVMGKKGRIMWVVGWVVWDK